MMLNENLLFLPRWGFFIYSWVMLQGYTSQSIIKLILTKECITYFSKILHQDLINATEKGKREKDFMILLYLVNYLNPLPGNYGN